MYKIKDPELYDMSQTELADELETSQQNINDMEKRAMRKFKERFTREEALEYLEYFDNMRRRIDAANRRRNRRNSFRPRAI